MPSSIVESNVKIVNVDATLNTKKDLINVTDYYAGNTLNQNVHVDHHIFKPIIHDADSTLVLLLAQMEG